MNQSAQLSLICPGRVLNFSGHWYSESSVIILGIMHILHLNYAFEALADGSALLRRYTTLTQLCEAQVQAGARVTVVQRFWRDENMMESGVVYHLRCAGATLHAKPWTLTTSLHQLTRDMQPDIVHVHGLGFPSQVLQLRQTMGSRASIVVQHHGEQPASQKARWLQRYCLAHVDGYLFTAKEIATVWRQHGIIRPRQPILEAIEGSCHFAPVPKSMARQKTGLVGNPAILWVGRLHARKDPLSVLDGFALARQQLPDAHLTMIYNDAPLLAQVQSRIAGSSMLRDRVHLIGVRPHADLPNWYSAADLFVTGSPAESCNYALIESLACGTHAVCSHIPAHRKITAHGKYGQLYAAGDARACADAILNAVSQAAVLPTDHQHHFATNLSWPAIATQTLQAYQAIVQAKEAYRA